MSVESFLRAEWDNRNQFELFESGWLLMLMVVMLGIVINYGITNSSLSFKATIYLFMLLIAFSINLVDNVWERNPLVEAVGYGMSSSKAVLALLAGVGLALVLNVGALSLATPLSAAMAGISFADSFFIVVIAAFAEEALFRNTLLPTLQKTFGTVFGFVVSTLLFGAFHYYAYSGNVFSIVLAMGYGAVFAFGNNFFKSSLFGYGGHAANNLLQILIR